MRVESQRVRFVIQRSATDSCQMRRVRGFSRDDAVAVRGDSLRHAVGWKDKCLADLPPGRYHLRAHVDRAAVFAVSITP